MKHITTLTRTALVAVALTGGLLVWNVSAAEGHDDVVKKVMKDYHKAPKGVDPVCKKASDGKASADDLKKLLDGYKAMAAAKPERGDAASWKEKCAKLIAATEALQKGAPDAAAKYKEAVNCKACHSVHKPE